MLRLALIFAAQLPLPALAAAMAQDPICVDVPALRAEFERARALHARFPQLRATLNEQQKWFTAVTGEMSSICSADKKFAAELLSRDRSQLTGQCKPAEEAMGYDQAVLEHSEKALAGLKARKEEFLVKGRPGVTDHLVAVYGRNKKALDDNAMTLDIDLKVMCELKWLYPVQFLKKTSDVTGCPPLPQFDKPEAEDKKDPALFAKLLTRFDLSIAYNTQRKSNAAATAKLSRAKYDACIAQNPEALGAVSATKAPAGSKAAAIPAKGKSPAKGSDITGTEDDRKKRNQGTAP